MSEYTSIVDPPEKGPQAERLRKLAAIFKDKYKKSPEVFIQCPGRVNMIGEHIDYCGYAVFPMAIEQDILVAAARNSTKTLQFKNTNSLYQDASSGLTDIQINKAKPCWYNYMLCGYKGLTEHLGIAGLEQGFDLMVDGTIPLSAGLSSSSAVVVSGALLTMYASGKRIAKTDLASLCAKCERYIGTEGGGMDQAIEILAEKGTAKLIEFNPLRTTDVKLPDGAVFVIANSLSELNKASTSDYNTRVVECRLATQIIAKNKGLNWREIRRLGDLQEALGVDLVAVTQLVRDILHKEPYTRAEVCGLLGLDDDQLNETSLSANTTHLQEFHLQDRALHVYTEAHRVWRFKEVCESRPDDVLQQLGDLMNASHASCRDLYDCSHPCLDELVEISKAAGALGARLTGAGWGGCTVSLVPTERLEHHLEYVRKNYYEVDDARKARIASSLFPTEPGRGALIINGFKD